VKLATAFLLLTVGATALEPVASTLGTVKRVYVESLGASPQAILLRDMVISSLSSSGFFVITEKSDFADALLRGSADDQVFMEQHNSTDSLSAGIHSGNTENYSSKYDHTANAKTSGLNIGQNESMHSNERRHEASASVRLINRDGDVIWSTTQESNGARFKSASADVADKIYRKLLEDLQKSRGTASAATQAGIPTR
jgi:hypothetical protein